MTDKVWSWSERILIIEAVQANSRERTRDKPKDREAHILKILDVPNPSGPKSHDNKSHKHNSGNGDEHFIRKKGKIIIERNGEEFELHKATRPATNNEKNRGFVNFTF